MPAEYKYEFISLGRMKALSKACEEVSTLSKEMAESKMIAPEILCRIKIIRTLVYHAANITSGDPELLAKLLEEDFSEEKIHL